MNTYGERPVKQNYSWLIGLTIFFISQLLIAASFVSESSADAALIIYGATFVFVFIIAPLFYFSGLLSGCCSLLRQTAEKRSAIGGILLNAFFLALTAVGWILIIIMFVMFIIKAASAWH